MVVSCTCNVVARIPFLYSTEHIQALPLDKTNEAVAAPFNVLCIWPMCMFTLAISPSSQFDEFISLYTVCCTFLAGQSTNRLEYSQHGGMQCFKQDIGRGCRNTFAPQS